MKRLVAALGLFLMTSFPSVHGLTADRSEECATTRDVQLVVVNLRDRGWSAQRIADAVLDVSKVQDRETRSWFLDLVSTVFEERTTAADVDAQYKLCIRQAPTAQPLRM